MVNLFLCEPNWKEVGDDSDNHLGKKWISVLKQLESVVWSLISSGGRSEAKLWLCKAISSVSSLSCNDQKELFVRLLRERPSKFGLASQLWQMIFEKSPSKAGYVLAKRSQVLEKFFEGNPTRILQWFSGFAEGSGLGKTGAKALSQFAFTNRDICWEELEWKGKHGQSPAVVATKPHYFLDLDVQQTVENFLEYVPEFWSSNEFAESLKGGDIFSIDTKFFIDFFVGLMYKEDARDAWKVISEFLKEESFSSLCDHLLITLEEQELCTVLELLHKYLNPRRVGDATYWFELVLSEYNGRTPIDQLLLLNAVINQGRQLLRLALDEEFLEEQVKIKDLVSQICTISSGANSLVPMLTECLKMTTTEAVKFLGIQSWSIHFALSDYCRTPESWESLFSNDGISFRKSDKFSLLEHDGFSEENYSELDEKPSGKRKHRKKKKSRKKRRRSFDDNDNYEYDLLDYDAPNDRKFAAGSWLLATDGFSASWTNVDLPEHISKFCFFTWMKWAFSKRTTAT